MCFNGEYPGILRCTITETILEIRTHTHTQILSG